MVYLTPERKKGNPQDQAYPEEEAPLTSRSLMSESPLGDFAHELLPPIFIRQLLRLSTRQLEISVGDRCGRILGPRVLPKLVDFGIGGPQPGRPIQIRKTLREHPVTPGCRRQNLTGLPGKIQGFTVLSGTGEMVLQRGDQLAGGRAVFRLRRQRPERKPLQIFGNHPVRGPHAAAARFRPCWPSRNAPAALIPLRGGVPVNR